MYPVSQTFQDVIKGTDRTFELKVHIDTAIGSYDLTDKDVVQGSLTLKESVMPSSSDTFSLGGAVAADLALTLFNYNGRFDHAQFNGGRMTARIGLLLPSGDYEYVPLGVFNIDDVGRPTTTISLDSADNMLLLDQPFSKVSVTYPATNKDILLAICDYCGLALHTTSFLNDDYVVQSAPDGTPSCRDIVSAIAELAASFARCTRDGGELELVQFSNPRCVTEADEDEDADGGTFDWKTSKTFDGGVFKETPVAADLTAQNRYDFSKDDDPLTITGVAYDGDDKTYLVGSDFYAVRISDNPLISGDPTDLLNSIFNILFDFNFLPFTSNWQGNPALQPGDTVLQTDRKGVPCRTITTGSTYVYRGSCLLEAKGVSKTGAGYQSSSSRTVAQLKRKIYDKQKKIDALTTAINQATSMLCGIWGGHVVNGDTLDNTDYHGNIFICDNVGDDPAHPDVTKATKVWRWNLGGFGYSGSGVNGPYATAITADGQIVADIITASMIRTGVLRALNGTSWIDLDEGSLSLGDGALIFDTISGGKLTTKDGKSWINLKDGSFNFASGGLTYSSANGLKASLSDGTYTQITGGGIQSTHTDGSYTTLDGGGLMHHDGSGSKEYHYLMYQVEVTFPAATAGGASTTQVQLPDEFKGKNFTVTVNIKFAQPSDSSGEITTISNVGSWIIDMDIPNALVTVVGVLTYRGISTGDIFDATEELKVTLTAIA